MTSRTHILAIDQGTSSSRAIVFDDAARPMASAQAALAQNNPQPGWVEQDPTEMASQTIAVARQAIRDAKITPDAIAAIGIAVQRETSVIWDRRTGTPLADAIVWQDRRTAARCEQLQADAETSRVWSTTGLVVDPYFSATKFEWLLQNAPAIDLRARAARGDIALGTVDSWLIDQLSRDPDATASGPVPHLTDVSNASRTMLLDIHDLAWSPELLELFGIPEAALPQIVPSAGVVAETHPSIFGRPIPIAGIAGDQQAATFGQACFSRGDLKCTYGTGAFILGNAGASSDGLFRISARTDTGDPLPDAAGTLFTVGWQIGGRRAYAIEGSVFATGATVQWLRDRLRIIDDPAETTAMATLVGDNAGVYLVPAFNGLGTPHWDPNARATITGMSSATDRNHIARAALEATAYQVHDVVQLLRTQLRQPAAASRSNRTRTRTDSTAGGQGIGSSRPNRIRPLRADGGQTRNPFLMQFQADILDLPVEVPDVDETTALGAAYLAGMGIGIWRTERELASLRRVAQTYTPDMPESRRLSLLAGWQEAIRRTRTDYAGM